ncbi:tetratricopeptide repeat protein [uncultured Brachyspira sp.]|uniref:tetratricopeptide repeat protein n=1 Tax=uncultured Brachyspira sp. TaxID=221953 RepID=UPI0025F0C028|nr:tetratricopeptide repeat protein [uncultured Brachyspira sp.]
MEKSQNNNLSGYLKLAKEKEEAGEYKEALQYYEKSIEEDPNNIEAYFGWNLINSYIEIGKEENKYQVKNTYHTNKHIELLNVFNNLLDNDEIN